MKKRAFTLIEVLIAIILVGLAIASLLGANIAFTRANGTGAQLSTAEFLIEQIREQTVTTPFADLANTSGFVPTSYPGYSQKTTVEYVNASDLRTGFTSPPTPFRRITVEISLNNKTISSACWIRASY